jgi:hypothetical protein
MRFRMCANIRKSRGILDMRNLPSIRISPTPALLKLHSVIVE